ncbi:tRNA 2-thiouridine(34) synthase MnmA [Mycoplasma sp. SG1]|uniref:tRNA 2-thiouridine(34) synthase MnmA n=1 Tax=Mycoplasma sp. SG1 TaxID=2810348 RepID=UPI0020251662|nr:tRNA 2-thiouridine(34) synthase MnmA [Mycoplasma sp. SG1]URM53136.1 tRNA 2-thiouridine(34) synthase MnmA [Mycoplasma sp. SG1]
MKNEKKKKTVVLALSGGIDSSLCAYLLKEQKFNVICVFIKCWDATLNSDILGNMGVSDEKGCHDVKDYKNAKQVADSLNLQLVTFNFVEEYWNLVFQHFLEDIKNGYTPNPDIDCNSIVKFDLFIKKAIKLYNPDFIATGHYAKIKKTDNGIFLQQAEDKSKDQSYFLASIKEHQLEKIIFPLENIYKKDIKNFLLQSNVNVNLNQKSSSGICFIGKRNFKNFLTNYFPIKPGKIIDIKTNQVLKEKHDGYYFYTIGQRKGLKLGGYGEKHFIVKKNIHKNILYVAGINEKKYLLSSGFSAKKMHLINKINEQKDLINATFDAVLRYQSKRIKIKITEYNQQTKKIKILFNDLQPSVTPGQFCVFYQDTTCIGCCQVDDVLYNEE